MKCVNGNTGLVGEFLRWTRGPGGKKYAQILTADGRKRLIFHRCANMEGGWDFSATMNAIYLERKIIEQLSKPSPWIDIFK